MSQGASTQGTDAPDEPGGSDFDPESYRTERMAELVGPLGHRLLNLLMTVLGNTSLVQRALEPESREARLLGSSERAALEASRVVGQVHTLLPGHDPATLDLGSVLRELAPLLAAVGGGRLRVEVEAPDGFAVHGGGGMVRLIVLHAVAGVVRAADGREGLVRVVLGGGGPRGAEVDVRFLAADGGPALATRPLADALAGPVRTAGGRVVPGEPVRVVLPLAAGGYCPNLVEIRKHAYPLRVLSYGSVGAHWSVPCIRQINATQGGLLSFHGQLPWCGPLW